MDIRIVNTCNNNCLYCLEQSLRQKNKYIEYNKIQDVLKKSQDSNLTFYGGNPLLHPKLKEIISCAKNNNFKNIGLLTNSGNLSESYLEELILSGLNSIGIYFYSFQEAIHDIYSGKSIKLGEVLRNISIIQSKKIFCKIIIHINKSNIDTVWKDIEILNKKFGIKNFEFIDYLLEDRAKKYSNVIKYDLLEKKSSIEKLFDTIKILKLDVKFVRFKKEFFFENSQFISQK